MANEARDLVRRAAGDVVGKTVAAQVRQAARNLDYPAESWRVREAWYGRAGAWNAAAVDDLRRRYMQWREREVHTGAESAHGSYPLVKHITALRSCLAEIERHFIALEAGIVGAGKSRL